MIEKIKRYIDEKSVEELLVTPCTMILMCIIIIIMAILIYVNQEKPQKIEIEIEPIPKDIYYEDPYRAGRIDEYAEIITNIDKKQGALEYYNEYISVTKEYSDVVELHTLADYFSEEELDYLYRTVETECHGASFECKANIARVILNRVDSERFPDSIKDVVTSPNQFAYGRNSIPDETKLACEYAFTFLTPAEGCLFFHSNSYQSKFSGADYRFSDECHHFYG